MASASSSLNINSSPTEKHFFHLAERVEGCLTDESRETLKKLMGEEVKLSSMFESISSIFKDTFKAIDFKAKSTSDYTSVLGITGVGKSTFVGYMEGAELEEQEVLLKNKSSKTTAVYKSESKDYPKQGHNAGSSETKGCAIFQHYIDTAGILDTAGLEKDICNAMAIDMVTKVFPAKRLIYVLSPSDIKEARATRFLETIRKIKRFLPNITSSNILTRVLFLINNTDLDYTPRKEKLKSNIQEIIEAKKGEQGDHTLSKGTPKDALEGVQKELAQKILELQEDIDILETVKEKFILADLFKDKTRKEIKAWEKESQQISSIPPLPLKMEHLAEQSGLKFRMTLLSAAVYFNELYKSQRVFEEHIKEANTTIEEINIEIKELGILPGTSNPAVHTEDCKRKVLLLEKKLPSLQDALLPIEKEISALQEKIERLSTDQTSTLLTTLAPDEPIVPRSIWGIMWPKTYPFVYRANIPVQKFQPVTSTENSSFQQDPNSSRTFHYTPAYYGYEEDSNAQIQVYVATKDHPSSLIYIKDLNNKLTVLNEELSKKSKDMQRHSSHITDLKRAIQENKAKEQNYNRTEILIKDLEELTKSQEANKKELERINSEIEPYKDFCLLISKIIHQLNLSQTSNNAEQSIFNQFCQFIS